MDETPASLLGRLRGQPEGRHWERFVLLFTPLLSRWGARLGVGPSDVEDLLQESFLLLLRKLPEFRYDERKSFRAWLWTVFSRHALAWRKRHGRGTLATPEQLASLASPDVADAGEGEYRRHLLGRALALVRGDFPEATWRLFLAVAVEGRPGVEVAREFGVTPNAVYLARGRVLARLREELAGLDS